MLGGAKLGTISIENVTFGYDIQGRLLFEDMSFDFDDRWKLGIIGKNGVGKTTFLKLLLDILPYKGSIRFNNTFHYFPLDLSGIDEHKPALLILQEFADFDQWELERECELLKLNKHLLWAPLQQYSGGERTKLLLAFSFIDDTSFPLIDEPTNHLDKKSREQVQAYLNTKKGYIVVSHDQQFMEAVTDHLLIIDHRNADLYTGDFQDILLQRNLEEQEIALNNKKLKKEIERLDKTAQEKKIWGTLRENDNKGRNIAARLNKRAKAIEQRKNREVEKKKSLLVNTYIEEHLPMYVKQSLHDTLLSFHQFSLRYDQDWLFEPVSFSIKKGERVIISGDNGSGKTSILKEIMQIGTAETKGQMFFDNKIAISYIRQDFYQYKGSIIDFCHEHHLDYTQFLNCLHKLGMERHAFDTEIELLSMGQRKKIEVAKSLLTPAELYIWDEPLNYLDSYNQQQLLKVIHRYQPSLLVIEHDSIMQDITNRIIHLN